MKNQKIICFLLCMLLFSLNACDINPPFNTNAVITVVSREEGSGTQGAFIELFNIIYKGGPNGPLKNLTTDEAIITNATDIMLTTVASDKSAIGYISSGSIGSSIKPISIDGVFPSSENIQNGSYTISRPFNIVTQANISEITSDFIHYIMSKEGQDVIHKTYVSIDMNAPKYDGKQPSGKVIVSGSSSVAPVMEKLKEAYEQINPRASIEIQISDSTTGIQSALNNTCDISMISRELREGEVDSLQSKAIAIDGIVLIVNKENPIENLNRENVRKIFTGEITHWNQVK